MHKSRVSHTPAQIFASGTKEKKFQPTVIVLTPPWHLQTTCIVLPFFSSSSSRPFWNRLLNRCDVREQQMCKVVPFILCRNPNLSLPVMVAPVVLLRTRTWVEVPAAVAIFSD